MTWPKLIFRSPALLVSSVVVSVAAVVQFGIVVPLMKLAKYAAKAGGLVVKIENNEVKSVNWIEDVEENEE